MYKINKDNHLIRSLILFCIILLVEVSLVAQSSLPEGWHYKSMGKQEIEGYTEYNPETEVFTLYGTGDQMWQHLGNINFTYTVQSGNFEIVALISSMIGMNDYHANDDVDFSPDEEAGLTIRGGLQPSSRAYSVAISGSDKGGVNLYVIDGSGDNYIDRNVNLPEGVTEVKSPYWLKIQRAGNLFSAYVSNDGENWIRLDDATQELEIAEVCYGGLFCRGNASLVEAQGWDIDVEMKLMSAEIEFVGINKIESLYGVEKPYPTQFVNLYTDTVASYAHNVFRRLLTDVVDYSLSSSNTKICKVSNDSSVLYFIPKGTGICEVTLEGHVAGYTLVDEFPVVVWDEINGWNYSDIGNPEVYGYSILDNNVFVIGGSSGVKGFNNVEGYHYLYKDIVGDVATQSKIIDKQLVTERSFAGLSLNNAVISDTGALARILINGNDSLSFEWRSSGEESLSQAFVALENLPVHLKIEKEGDTITASTSADGIIWSQIGEKQTIHFADTFKIGLTTGSHDATSLSHCFFDEVVLDTDFPALLNSVGNLNLNTGDEVDIDISNVFGHNPDSIISIEANSSDETLLDVDINGDILTLSALSIGIVDVTLNTLIEGTELSDVFSVNISEGVPPEWLFSDIGITVKEGYASLSEDIFRVQSYGNTINSSSDNFSYLYKEIDGTKEVIVKINTISGMGEGIDAGIMFRESLNPSDLFIAYTLNDNGLQLKFRWDNDMAPVIETPVEDLELPLWLRLGRDDLNRYQTYYSEDGLNWVKHRGTSIPMEISSNSLAGVIATSTFGQSYVEYENIQIDLPTYVEINDVGEFDELSVKCYPNPFKNNTLFELNVISQGPVSIDIIDTGGSIIKQIYRHQLKPGTYLVEFNASSMPNGIYYYRITSSNKVINGKILKVD